MEPSLFFVPSGYLVSGIIWKYGAYVGASGPWKQRLRTFFTRRVLRIIPPYYLALVGALLLPLEVVQQHLLWFVLPALGRSPHRPLQRQVSLRRCCAPKSAKPAAIGVKIQFPVVATGWRLRFRVAGQRRQGQWAGGIHEALLGAQAHIQQVLHQAFAGRFGRVGIGGCAHHQHGPFG